MALNEKGIEEMLVRTIEVAVALKLIAKKELTRVIVDSKMQDKAIAPLKATCRIGPAPRGSRWSKPMASSSSRPAPKKAQLLGYKAGCYAHACQLKRRRKVIKRQRTIVGHLKADHRMEGC